MFSVKKRGLTANPLCPCQQAAPLYKWRINTPILTKEGLGEVNTGDTYWRDKKGGVTPPLHKKNNLIPSMPEKWLQGHPLHEQDGCLHAQLCYRGFQHSLQRLIQMLLNMLPAIR